MSERAHCIKNKFYLVVNFRVTAEATPNETPTVLDIENAKTPETKGNAAVTVSTSVNKLVRKHRYIK